MCIVRSREFPGDAGVFSMDGHIAPLKEIARLAEKHGALVRRGAGGGGT